MYRSFLNLAETVQELRSGRLELKKLLATIRSRMERAEPVIQALLPEPGRWERLERETEELLERYPYSEGRPPLFGVPVGVKDIFHVRGFLTQAGSNLPPSLFQGAEGPCVRGLREAGALILGKTVTTEFAYFAPGPTHNPIHPDHTPGGSSSGSAAGVAAGFYPLALGTQTIGSVIRPAAFCGIYGFKPTYERISREGVLEFSRSADHIGLFTQDAEGMEMAASVLCRDWRKIKETGTGRPTLAIPAGPYLEQASPEGLDAFHSQVMKLERAGYQVERVRVLDDIEEINTRHRRMIFAEMAAVHQAWFKQYESLYRPETGKAIRTGQEVKSKELAQAQAGREVLRRELEEVMTEKSIRLWISPSAPGPAPQGIIATGNPIMNLPWTYAGMPVVNLPAGVAANGLPLGLQVTAGSGEDELLLQWSKELAILFTQ